MVGRNLQIGYADKIVVGHEWHSNREKRASGSGTPNYNTHIDSYEPLDAFCPHNLIGSYEW